MTKQNSKTPRPIWVWLISICYFAIGVSGLMAVSMALIIHAQGGGPTGEVPQINDLMRSSLWGLLPAANIAGALSLFLMRRIAFPIFSGLLAAKVVLQLLFETPLSKTLSAGKTDNIEMLIGYGFGYVILLAVCIYTWRLKNAGLLR